MKDDLISRQLAINAIEKKAYRHTYLDQIIDIVSELPSAQPDIIRCRDCKYWREHKYSKETKRYIPFCGFNAIYTKADDFCSSVERRTDEQTD